MKPSYSRESRVIIDLEAIRQNVRLEKERLTSDQQLFAVVKANGYGHGAVQVAKAAREAGATGFCVSNFDEALELRESGITVEPILVLSYVSSQFLEQAIQEEISLTAPSLAWLSQAEETIAELGISQKISVHLKIDTGMGRIGIREEEEMRAAALFLEKSQHIEWVGLFTHFATADTVSTTYFEKQKAVFTKARALFPNNIPYVHTANSATALWHDAWGSNVIRFGDAMYGMNPSGKELNLPYSLVQALSLETALIHVKKIKAGEKIGYGITYETTEEEWIGTLPIGYADGVRRTFQGFEVLIEGERVPIVGRICMDQCMIRLPRAYSIGTKVTIIGSNGAEFISTQEVAEHLETINYEVTCDLSDRLPRYYLNE
ncbi:alanine racemase [Vagococcus sp.]|uniref:alanine racemase n=1 Tax=Vagococcus sp. TaxID=1933889 RepID=UPI003F9E0F1F